MAEDRTFTRCLIRGLTLRCPWCGGGPLFVKWFRMHERCAQCDRKYERSPGYFLGSTYINYGLTAFLLTALYVSLHFGAGFENRTLTIPLLGFCVVFPLVFFRFARGIWLAADSFFDSTEETHERGRHPK